MLHFEFLKRHTLVKLAHLINDINKMCSVIPNKLNSI